MFNNFWKWVCLLWMQIARGYACQKKFGMDLVSPITAEFAVSLPLPLKGAGWSGCDSGGWGLDCIRSLLTSAVTTLPWSAAEISQIWEQEPVVTEVKSDRGGKDEGKEKSCLAAGTVSVLVWRKSWQELHLSEVIERISRVWFCDVQKWTEPPQLTGLWYISLVTAGM